MSGIHGGPDALGVPRWDFSTNANAVGPCPMALTAMQRADPQHYPDPAYTDLRAALAAFHGVAVERIVVAGSASEFIARLTAAVARLGGRQVWLPALAYGDYAHAAQAWGLQRVNEPAQADLLWLCEPASPLGNAEPMANTVAGLRSNSSLRACSVGDRRASTASLSSAGERLTGFSLSSVKPSGRSVTAAAATCPP